MLPPDVAPMLWRSGLSQASAATPTVVAVQNQQAEDDDGPLTEDNARSLLKQVRALDDLLKLQQEAIDTTRFDPAALTASVKGDRDRLLQYVRQTIAVSNYVGALRSPATVMMNASGNRLDRARLLAQLLAESGQTVRLAKADLDADQLAARDQAEAALAEQRAEAAAEAGGDTEIEDAAFAEIAKATGIDEAAIRTAVAAQQVEREGTLETAAARIYPTMGRLAPLVEGQAASSSSAATDAAHWWVQVRDGETWVDLDPVADGLAEAQQTFDAATIDPEADFKPLSLQFVGLDAHRVTIRVIGTQSDGDTRQDHVVLQHTLDASDAAAIPISLTLTPMDLPADLDPFAAETEDEGRALVRGVIVAQEEWLPNLDIGGQAIGQASIRDTGELVVNPIRDGTGRKVAGAGRALGGLGQGESTSTLAAMRLEFIVESPGIDPITEVRTLFDFVPEGRLLSAADLTDEMRLSRAYAMLRRTQALVQTGRWTADYAERIGIEGSRRGLRQMPAALGKAIQNETAEMLQGFDATVLAPAMLLNVGVQRFELHPDPRQIVVHRPNIFVEYASIDLASVKTGDGTVRTREVVRSGIDIVANPVMATGPSPRDMVMLQGICDTVAEAMSLSAADRNPARQVVTPTSLFVGGGLKVIKSVAQLEALDRRFDDTVGLAMQTALTAGQWIVLSQQGNAADRAQDDPQLALAPTAWWRIDPSTGQTLGMLGQTGGAMWSPMVEYLGAVMMAVAFILAMVTTFMGCGGYAEGVSNSKKANCALCGLFAGVTAAIAVFLALPLATAAAGGATVSAAAGLGALKGAAMVMAEQLINAACNVLGATTS